MSCTRCRRHDLAEAHHGQFQRTVADDRISPSGQADMADASSDSEHLPSYLANRPHPTDQRQGCRSLASWAFIHCCEQIAMLVRDRAGPLDIDQT
jgi:hypothetical protein